jgi:hypothetical protein
MNARSRARRCGAPPSRPWTSWSKSTGCRRTKAVAVKRFFDSHSRSPHRTSTALDLDSEARLWLGAAAAQREVLLRLWRKEEIGDDVLTRLEREIDLAEARLARDD